MSSEHSEPAIKQEVKQDPSYLLGDEDQSMQLEDVKPKSDSDPFRDLPALDDGDAEVAQTAELAHGLELNETKAPEAVKVKKEEDDSDNEMLEEGDIDFSEAGQTTYRLASQKRHHQSTSPSTGTTSKANSRSPQPQSGTVNVEAGNSARSVNQLVNTSSSSRKLLFFLRHRLQNLINELEKKKGDLPQESAQQILTLLDHIACHPLGPPWTGQGRAPEGWFFRPEADLRITKIEKRLRSLIRNVKRYPQPNFDMIAERAQQLLDHWESGLATPIFLGPMADKKEEEESNSEVEEPISNPGIKRSPSRSASPGPSRRIDYREREPMRPRSRPSEIINPKVRAAREDLLRGIIVKKTAKTTTYSLDRAYSRRRADSFGSNGLRVGQWWPLQICALRDGAHGAKQGGIYGRIDVGCFSIVISNNPLYENNDNDQGNRILYSGSKGAPEDQDSQLVPVTTATKSLIVSEGSNQPVRVLRSSKLKSRWAPKAGLRYDGLYRVVGHTIEIDSKNGESFHLFELRRDDPDPICLDRPTKEEISDWALVRDTQD